MNDPEAQIEDFRERAAIMEYEAFPEKPEPDEIEARRRRVWATLEAAKLVWGQEFVLQTLDIHLTRLRQEMEKAA